MANNTANSPKNDRWISSACSMCYGMCSIRGHVVDGTLVKIEGNPDSPIGSGRLCAKGVAGIMMLYDPNRLDRPLRRTNPEKGIGIDPKWEEISWEEALDIVCEKLKKCYDEEPRSLVFQATTTCASTLILSQIFAAAFGTPNSFSSGGGLHCGNGAHGIAGVMHASWSVAPDYRYCDYVMYFGCSKGYAAGHVANQNTQDAADARARGMKMVVIDPMCNFAAGKATEWVPIRVGTDAALALAMANIIVNELGIYDRKYLGQCTNAPYLIKEDGLYLRDPESNKPMIWDAEQGVAKTFDDPTVSAYVIEGAYTVDGHKVQPGFQILKDHLKKFTAEYAARITTIPQATIRRLARELAQAARVGSTIVIDGVEVPYRPACAVYFRGIQGHKNSLYNCMAVSLLNHILGNADAAGGCLGFNPVSHGHPETGGMRYVPKPDADGLMVSGTWMHRHWPYPIHAPTRPTSFKLSELFPIAIGSPFICSSDREEWWSKFNISHRPKILMSYGANSVMSIGNKDIMADWLKQFEFIVSFDILLNETTDFADIVLPDTTYMERLEPQPNFPIFSHPPGLGTWAWPIRQPLVEPVAGRRNSVEVIYEIADRIGLREPMNVVFNVRFDLHDKYKLAPNVKYEYNDIVDRVLKDKFGDERGLEWFKEHGLITWPKNPREVYWRYFTPVRVPIYFEFIKRVGDQARKLAREFDAENDIDFSMYEPVPDFHPCPSHTEPDPAYDFISFYFRDTIHTNSLTMENPWLDEASHMNPYTYNITINADVAKRKGLKNGDIVWVESKTGRKVKGKLNLSEGIHPEGLGVAALCGHWSKNQPIARGKGIFYNELIEIDWEHTDNCCHSMDLCVKVKVYKA